MKKYFRHIISYTNKVLLVSTLVAAHNIICMMPGQQMQMPRLQSGPSLTPQGQSPMVGPSNGGMHMPSDAELEAMFKEIEKIAAENPEIIKEWEREGQRAIMAMSDSELNEFSQLMGLDPAQLREEAARALAGELPQEIIPEPIKQEPVKNKPEKQPEKPLTPTSKSDINVIKQTIQELISTLARIKQIASSVRDVYEMVREWSQELRDLMFYLHVIDQDEHYKELALPEFKNLVKIITELQKNLSLELPNLIVPDDLTHQLTPYDMLDISSQASEKEINAAYENLAQKNNPKVLEKKLRAEGISDNNIKRLVKAARINFEVIEETYEQLKDEKLRKQINRTIQAEEQFNKQKLERAQEKLKNIKASLSQAIYSKQVLTELERFLQNYAQQEAALKKKMDEAEKKQAAEQKKRQGMRATETPGRYDQTVSYSGRGNDYGYHSDFPSYYDSKDWDRYRPDFNYGEKPREEEKKPSEKPGEKTKEEKEKEEKTAKENAEKKAIQKKSDDVDKRSIDQLMNEIEKDLKLFGAEYTKSENKISLTNFNAYAQEKEIKKIITPAQEAKYENLPATPYDWDTLGLTPEEREKEELKYLQSAAGEEPFEPFKTIRTLVKEAVSEKLGEPSPAPVNRNMSTTLKELEKNLKIDKLSENLKNLSKKIKIEKPKLSSQQEKSWKAIAESYRKQKKSIETLKKQLETAQEEMTAEKQKAHEQELESFLENIQTIVENYNSVNKKFED